MKKIIRTITPTTAIVGIACMAGAMGSPQKIEAAPAAEESKAPQTLITNVSVWDGTADKSVAADVLIEGDKIKQVAKGIKADGATVIDGKGGTLIPGLIDSHQHIMLSKGTGPNDIMNAALPYTAAYNAIPQGKIMLMMGVTTIRDIGGPSVELGRAIDGGIVDGPRIYSCSAMISCTSGHGDWGGLTPHQQRNYPGSAAAWMSGMGLSHLADGADEVRRATRLSLAGGAAQIKIMAGGGVASLKDPL